MSGPVLTRDGVEAMRALHALLPAARPEVLFEVADWAIGLAGDVPVAGPCDGLEVCMDDIRFAMDLPPAAAPAPPAAAPAPPAAARRGQPPWPDADLARMEAMLADGAGWAEIGKALGRNRDTVRKYAQARGLGLANGRATRPWADADLEQLLQMLAEGLPIGEIAAAMCRTEVATVSRIRKLDRDGDKRYRAALSARRKSAHPPAKRDARRWSADEDRRLDEMRAAGHSAEEIAAALDRSVHAVGNRVWNRRQAGDAVEPVSTQPPPAVQRASVALEPAPAVTAMQDSAAVVRPPAPRSAREHQIETIRAHLDRLPWDERFSSARDYEMARRLLSGTHSRSLAAEWGMSAGDIGQRFRAMVPADLRARDGAISINGIPLLLEALRLNAEEDAGAEQGAEAEA